MINAILAGAMEKLTMRTQARLRKQGFDVHCRSVVGGEDDEKLGVAVTCGQFHWVTFWDMEASTMVNHRDLADILAEALLTHGITPRLRVVH